ncbi:Hydrolase [Neofusicoccum parvum]|nr:Hydrolase [Neofusicoccum parvum]
MGDSRYSARLRKRPRVSYAQPDEEDLDIDDEGSTRVTATVGEADDDEDDEEFSLNGRKRTKKASAAKRGRGRKQQAFRFMDLPGELRNAIYELTLTRATIEIHYAFSRGRHTVKSPRRCTYSLHPNLLLLNKTIRAEAGPILYQNQFDLWDCTSLWHFISSLSPTTKSWIKHLGLLRFREGHIDKGYCVPAFHSLIGLASLKSLELIWIRNSFYGQGHLQEIVRAASLWIESVGREKNDKYAALDLINVSSWFPQTERDAGNKLLRSHLKNLIK